MSVIFEALKRVRQLEKEPFDQEVNDSPPANVYTIRGLLFSPQGILGIAILVLLFGGMVYLGASYLGDMASRKKGDIRQTPKDAVAYIPPEDSHNTSGKMRAAAPSVPPSPQQANYERAQPGVLYLPPKVVPTGDKSKGPLVVPEESALPQARAPVVNGMEQATAAEQSPFRKPKSFRESCTVKRPDLAEASTNRKDKHTIVMTHRKKKESMAGSLKLQRRAVISEDASQTPIIVSKRNARQARMLESSERQGVQERGSEESTLSTLKTAQISQVVSRLQVAMALGDEQKVDNLMPRLEYLKGKDDPFVLKLKAYWLMKKGRYEDAGRLLMRVMEQNPKDLEAGINMAIVEIKTGQIGKARQRLSNLREIYPVNSKIPELLRKING